MNTERYEVRLDNIFEGPMDLLVYLIQKNEVDIYDIPIALITDQYLGYLTFMEAMNIDVAGDFILMAATLTQIKSKMLLPVHDDDEEAEDPRMEIARPLAEYLRMKSAAEALSDRPLLGEDIFLREPIREEMAVAPEEVSIRIGLFELIDAFQRVLENLPGSHRIDLSEERISIKDRITELVAILETKGSVAFDELFPPAPVRGEVVITFLAILEMARLCLIQIHQHLSTGVIRLIYQ
jgi:segregation and condensation protein A